MRRLILTAGLLAAALMATPQAASAQANPNQPIGGGGGERLPNPADPALSGPNARPDEESVGRGEMRRGTEPDTRGRPGMLPSDQPIGGGGGEHMPNPSAPRR